MASPLIRISRGIWVPAATADPFAERALALLAASPPGAVLGGLAAAVIHQLWLPDVSQRPMEVLVHGDDPFPRDFCASRRPELRVRRRRLRADEIMFVGSIPLTTIACTWVHLAEQLGFADLVAAGDSALRAGVTQRELAAAVAGGRGQRGIVRAREALLYLDARSRSRPESHLRCAVTTDHLPRPEVNVAVYDQFGQWLAEPDLSYADVRLALEYNGAEHAEVRRMRKDITRELDLDNRGGWRTLVFGPAEVFGRPDLIAPTVLRARREQQLLTRHKTGGAHDAVTMPVADLANWVRYSSA